jgi:hemolysin III
MTVPDDILKLFGRPYSRAELISDGAVHVAALAAAVMGLSVLIVQTAAARGLLEVSAVVVYGVGLVVMLGCSLAYNMAPVSPLKALLRRFDHSGIFLMIAGTYTPFLTQLTDSLAAFALAGAVWGGAIAGIVMALGFPGRGERYKVAAYLALSWVAVLALVPLWQSLPMTSLVLLAGGGLLYTAGVVFYRWQSLRFQNVIWHGFVVAAATCHFAAIATAMT